VDFYGSSLEKVDLSPFARKVLPRIHDYLGKRISIISLLLHKVFPHNDDSIPSKNFRLPRVVAADRNLCHAYSLDHKTKRAEMLAPRVLGQLDILPAYTQNFEI
jgi:hypothetical protein